MGINGSEAVNLYGHLMETDTSNPWTVVTDVSHYGVSCARSGVIGHGGMTWLQTSMRKASTVSFGLPHVTWSPNLNTNGEVRVYTVFGKTNLTDAAWVCPTTAAHRFFKVKVEMP